MRTTVALGAGCAALLVLTMIAAVVIDSRLAALADARGVTEARVDMLREDVRAAEHAIREIERTCANRDVP